MDKINDETVKAGSPLISDEEVTGKDAAVQKIMIKCSCGAILRVRRELAGKKVRCKNCGNILVVSAQDQLQESLLGKLQEKVVDLAKKLEAEQQLFRESFESKQDEIKTLKEEFAEKENSWINEKKKLTAELAKKENSQADDKKRLDGEFAKEETDWMSEKKEMNEELILLKAALAHRKNSLQEKQDEYEEQISRLSEELIKTEVKLRDVEAEMKKERQEYKEKTV